MRILAILAIVAATGVTVGCSKQPTTAESNTPQQQEQETAEAQMSAQQVAKELNESAVSSDAAKVEADAPLTALSQSNQNDSMVVKQSESSKLTTQRKQQSDTKVEQPTAPVTSSSNLITKLLDAQAEQAKQAKLAEEKIAKEKQEIEAQKVLAEQLVQQSQSVADLPPVDLEGYTFFGDPSQPGYQVQVEIFTHVAQGMPLDEATNKVIEQILNDDDSVIGGEANRMVSLDVPVSTQFIGEISRVTNLTDATKLSIETVPDRVDDIITLGVVLYPDYAQDIINAAALTGEISEQDALVLAIAAGADPTTVSTATASGPTAGAIAAIPVPLGSGVGAGGAGGGDTTASTN
jgi:hypothetical protein